MMVTSWFILQQDFTVIIPYIVNTGEFLCFILVLVIVTGLDWNTIALHNNILFTELAAGLMSLNVPITPDIHLNIKH